MYVGQIAVFCHSSLLGTYSELRTSCLQEYSPDNPPLGKLAAAVAFKVYMGIANSINALAFQHSSVARCGLGYFLG